MENQVPQPIQNSSWFDSLKAQFQQLSVSSTLIFQVVGSLIGGFVAGFLMKQFGRHLIWIIAGSILILWVLEMVDVISINYRFVQQMMGISSDSSVGQIYHQVLHWAKEHIFQLIAFLVGFYLARLVS